MPFVSDPVALPGLAALATGVFAFLCALLLARLRGRRAPDVADGKRRNASIGWIVVQGLSYALVGMGPILTTRDPLSPGAILTALTVLLLMLVATAVFDASSRALGQNWALVARTRGDASLIETGPFAHVRNPIYGAMLLVLVAMALACGHLASLLIALPVFALGTAMRIRAEEAVLRATFGSAYERYAARVKRFVPGLF